MGLASSTTGLPNGSDAPLAGVWLTMSGPAVPAVMRREKLSISLATSLPADVLSSAHSKKRDEPLGQSRVMFVPTTLLPFVAELFRVGRLTQLPVAPDRL